MKALLRKDLPWMAVCWLLGLVALTAAVCEHSFVRVFVTQAARAEALFHAAWIVGVVVGMVAANFDRALGAREFLWHRPVAPARVAFARLSAVGIVVSGCLLLVPWAAWACFFAFDSSFEWGFFGGVPGLWGNAIGVVSGAAIGLFAGSLPVAWTLRGLVAAAAFAAVFVPIGVLARDAEHVTSPMPFVAGHLGAAAVLLWGAYLAMQVREDADRPWVRRGSRAPAAVAVGVVVVAWCFVATEFEITWLRRLHGAYPDLCRQDDQVSLARYRWNDRLGRDESVLVDDDHRELGPTATPVVTWGAQPVLGRSECEVEPPMWGSFGDSAVYGFFGQVFVDPQGRCWHKPIRGSLVPTGIGPQHGPLPVGSSLTSLGEGDDRQVIAADRRSGMLWRFDESACTFAALPLPDGDRYVGTRYERTTDLVARGLAGVKPADGQDTSLLTVRGERRGYVLRRGAWCAFELVPTAVSRSPVVVAGDDPVTFDAFVPVANAGSPWRHTFTPRTAIERTYAAIAMAASVLRPPLAQLAGSFAPLGPRTWLVDPLLAGWRRPWLTASCVLLALWWAWAARRRLAAFGAEPASLWLWSLAIAIGGLPAAILCACFERPRAYARRALPGPFAAPRIRSDAG